MAGNVFNQNDFFPSTVAINAANDVMVKTGFAVRLVGNATTAWSSAGSSDFATGANWSSGAPTTTAYVAFNAADASQRTVDFGGSARAMRGILFGAGATDEGFTFQNGTLQIGRGGIGNYSEATQTLSSDLNIALTDHQYWDAIHGDLDIRGSVDLNGKLLVVQGDYDTTLSGVVKDSSGIAPGLTKYGLGTLTLESAATYTGKTWIYGGTLSLGAGGSLASSTSLVLADNATTRLELNGHTQSVSGLQSVAGSDSSRATIDLGSGGRLNVDVADGGGIYSGKIAGGTSGGISLQLFGPTVGNQYIGLAGPSTFAGQTLIERGNVYIQNVDALGASGAGNETIVNFTDDVKPNVRFSATGTMNETVILRNISGATGGSIGSTTTFTSSNLTLNGPIILSRAITEASRGSSWTFATINSNGVVAGVHFGDITGALEAGATTGAGGSLFFQLYKDSAFYLDGVIGQGTLGSDLAVYYRGEGSISINNANTYKGISYVQTKRTIVNVDALSGQAGAFGNATSAIGVGGLAATYTTELYAGNNVTIGRNLTVSAANTAGVTIGALDNATALYSGTVALSRTETVFTAGENSTVTFNNTISNGSGTPKITKQGAGTVIFSGSNTYSGGTTVQAGLLRASNNYALGTAGTVLVSGGNLEIASGVTLANSNVRLAGGQITVNGTLNALDFQSGRLSGSGTVNASLALNDLSRILSPGNSPGTQTIGGNQTWSGFTYEWEINNFSNLANTATSVDLLSLNGRLTLGGTYKLDIISLTAGNLRGSVENFSETERSWTILTASAGITGFSASDWVLDAGLFSADGGWDGEFSLTQQGNSLVLNYVPEPSACLLALGAMAGAALRRKRMNGRR